MITKRILFHTGDDAAPGEAEIEISYSGSLLGVDRQTVSVNGVTLRFPHGIIACGYDEIMVKHRINYPELHLPIEQNAPPQN